ncbi:hypothetical protein M2150_002093 [Lachnospiraceae bacterium PM6-15]|uniref:Pilus assembly protein n=1 Tax=Ohessyouella blattaphilus TaxID=2949333 RepID=A0ABT1EJU2_9FIRM|nr:pilus assembly protein [Ohessyouella blattaphilus]MCP1110022.1 pilus assembly protein [Ohessyouella blattaphilus]MCR8563416.1 pilus assembly protein [Ohessyouella blattaphilus]
MTKKIPLSEDTQEKSVKRTSVTVSARGSITLEAALALPLFFLAMLTLAFLLETLAIKTSMRSALYSSAKKVAAGGINELFLSTTGLEQEIQETIGRERLARSLVKSGSISCSGSYLQNNTGMLYATVTYELEMPFVPFRPKALTQRDELRLKAWTGYTATGSDTATETVYITETGLVYHVNHQCTHLQLSIQMVTNKEVFSLRNENGGKYHPCEQCQKGTALTSVYITDYGDRYHGSLSCSGLKRTIYAVPINEVIGKGRCKRCG